jgi:membrane-bound lytic murein transglycosylase MltF
VKATFLLAGAVMLSAVLASAEDGPEVDRRWALRVLAVVSPEEPFFVSAEPRGGFDWDLLEGFANLQRVRLELVTVPGWDDLQIGMFLGRPASLAWGVRKEDARLHRALNEYLGNVRRTATWSRLAVKHFGNAALEILRKARGEP